MRQQPDFNLDPPEDPPEPEDDMDPEDFFTPPDEEYVDPREADFVNEGY